MCVCAVCSKFKCKMGDERAQNSLAALPTYKVYYSASPHAGMGTSILIKLNENYDELTRAAASEHATLCAIASIRAARFTAH